MNNLPKFRAWHKANKTMHEVLAWKAKGDTLPVPFICCSHIKENDKDCLVYEPISDYILMQSTGLRDKNGVEIFEGDILKSPNWWWSPGEVKFTRDEDALNKIVITVGDSWNIWSKEELEEEIEIIGNRYQHSELLGESK